MNSRLRSVVAGLVMSALYIGCFRNMQTHYHVYKHATFTVDYNEQVTDVRLILSSFDGSLLISRVEINGATLELENVTPEKWKVFLDDAQIEYDASDTEFIQDKGMYKCAYIVEDIIPNIYIHDDSHAMLTIRSTGKTVTLPFPKSELIAKFGKPDSIETYRSRQP